MHDRISRDRLVPKIGAALVSIAAAQIVVDGTALGWPLGAFGLGWLALLVVTRRATVRVKTARIAVLAAAWFAGVMIDDPSFLTLVLFGIALGMATLLPRRGFDDAIAWSARLAWLGLTGIVSPLRDAARLAAIRQRRGERAGTLRAVATMLIVPVIGGAIFFALFAAANPLIEHALSGLVLPDPWTLAWRMALGIATSILVWASLRPAAGATRIASVRWNAGMAAFAPGTATLALSLVTFNAIFAIENGLDIAFLWSGAALPGRVTMADYAHRGAYSLIVTALLAGLFVIVALRPGGPAGASVAVRRLVALWIAQNLLLVASSMLRTIDYVDAYGMTVWRLSALIWMALVAIGLALIGWRVWRRRSARWLINANALAATVILALASVIDLGASAAAWNARVARAKGMAGPPLDLCYMARLGSSALVPLADLEAHAASPVLRDRLAYLRWQTQSQTAIDQHDWRSWTPRDARRLARVEAIAGIHAPRLRDAPDGRGCGGVINRPSPAPLPPPTPLTATPQR